MTLDPVEFEIMFQNLGSIAKEMGIILRKSSYSPNIRERMDASCAVFGPSGTMLAQAEHIPVHLGSMHLPLLNMGLDLEDGDQVLLNDPMMGGTHLPDITLYKPIYFDEELVGYVGNRAHHADIGGIAPGSMPGLSNDIFQEGLILPPLKFIREGEPDRDILSILLANTRTPEEREGDIMAQVGANNYGQSSVMDFIDRHGKDKFVELREEIRTYTRRLVRKRLLNIPTRTYQGEEIMETVEESIIRVRVKVGTKIMVDFSGTSPSTRDNLNAPLAVTHSAVYFFFRTLLGGDVPSNSTFYEFFDIRVPEGTILNPPRGRAVVGGNVETSQRVVDCLLKAFSRYVSLPAQSHGTMNNVSFGNNRFTYYETIGGGAGAALGYEGESGVHVYMTNTKNTPVEVIEATYPIQCLGYGLRHGSGGGGKWRGGEGIIKHYRVLEPCVFSIISGRRRHPPEGLMGGGQASRGSNIVIRSNKRESIGGRATIDLGPGDEVLIMTPGGGGYGQSENDVHDKKMKNHKS